MCNAIVSTLRVTMIFMTGPNSRRKKSLDREMVPPGLNIEDGRNNITCEAAGDWSTVAGMDDWCTKNCPIGNDDTTCLAEYCTCHSAEGK